MIGLVFIFSCDRIIQFCLKIAREAEIIVPRLAVQIGRAALSSLNLLTACAVVTCR